MVISVVRSIFFPMEQRGIFKGVKSFDPSLIPDNYFQQFLGVFVEITVCFSSTES